MNKLGRDPLDIEQMMLAAWRLAQHSEDPSTQLGAVLFRECDTDNDLGDYILRGVNHLPRGTDPKVWQVREQKYQAVIHAEVAVINAAKALNYPTEGATLVCPWACCFACAKKIVEAEIGMVVVDDGAMKRTPKRWKESIEMAHQHLKEHRVEVLSIPTPKNKPETLFDGRVW